MRFQISILDRLTSGRDASRQDAHLGVDVAQLKKMVAQDLENLLNSRRCLSDEDFKCFPLSARSVINFGVPDFAAKSLSSGIDRDHICASMVKAIEYHDQRLKKVVVRMRDDQSEVHRLAFDIHAVLLVVGLKDEVNFDVQFDSSGMYYQVNT